MLDRNGDNQSGRGVQGIHDYTSGIQEQILEIIRSLLTMRNTESETELSKYV